MVSLMIEKANGEMGRSMIMTVVEGRIKQLCLIEKESRIDLCLQIS